MWFVSTDWALIRWLLIVMAGIFALPHEAEAACPEGRMKECPVNGKKGTSDCINGRWTKCDTTAGPGDPEPPPPVYPGGSYRGSCAPRSFIGFVLVAGCKDMAGTTVTTELRDTDRCQGDIWNSNGRLHCNRWTTPPPVGSYQESCPFSWLDGSPLTSNLGAACVGYWNDRYEVTLASPASCFGDIFLVNRTLNCSRQPFPGGPYQANCKHILAIGSDLSATCQKRDGTWATSRLVGASSCAAGQINSSNGILICGAPSPPPTFAVPNMVGMNLQEAKAAIASSKFKWGRFHFTCVGFEVATQVVSQDPGPGAMKEADTRVDLTGCAPVGTPIAPCGTSTPAQAYTFAAQCSWQCTTVDQPACTADQAKLVVQQLFPASSGCEVNAGRCQSFYVTKVCSDVCESELQAAVNSDSAVKIVKASFPQCSASMAACRRFDLGVSCSGACTTTPQIAADMAAASRLLQKRYPNCTIKVAGC